MIAIFLTYIYYSFGHLLELKMSAQEKRLWCWAASTQMVLDFKKDSIKQCDIYKKIKGINNPDTCCEGCHNVISNCDIKYSDTCSQSLDISLKIVLDSLGWNADTTNIHNFSWKNLKEQIDLQMPIIIGNLKKASDLTNPFTGFWTDHMFVIYGYAETCQTKWVLVRDPWQVCTGCTYALDFQTLQNGDSLIVTENIDMGDDLILNNTPLVYYNIKSKHITDFDILLDTIEKYLLNIMYLLSDTLCNFQSNESSSNNSTINLSNFVKNNLNELIRTNKDKILKEVGLTSKINYKIDNPIPTILFIKNNNSKVYIETKSVQQSVRVYNDQSESICEITLQQTKDGLWKVIQFKDCPWLTFQKSIETNCENTSVLNKLKELDPNNSVKEIAHVYFNDDQFQFYKLQIMNEIYYFPRFNYSGISYNLHTQKQFNFLISNNFKE